MTDATPKRTFFFRQEGGAFYLIPDDVTLPPGDLDLRSLSGKVLRVDAEAARTYETDKDTAHAHLKTQLYSRLGRFGDGLLEAWKRAVEEK
ncbi:hypothetical protein ACLESO_33770 [Pyxidicoccus sp. 3LG]